MNGKKMEARDVAATNDETNALLNIISMPFVSSIPKAAHGRGE
jgi:hypothetical protein